VFHGFQSMRAVWVSRSTEIEAWANSRR
jgi:hypothetical protein